MILIENDPQLEEKRKEYMDYIDRHIANVQKAFEIYGAMLVDKINLIDPENSITLEELKHEVEKHDMSKYSKEEFDGYRMHFFSTDMEKQNPDFAAFSKIAFEKAWNNHLHSNNHHPEYWCHVDNTKIVCIPMSNLAIVHMCLDWQAMSLRPDDSPYTFWNNNRDKKAMNKSTMEKVDYLTSFLKDSMSIHLQ